MKFFTPELLEAASAADPVRARAAHERWEQATVDYSKRLQEIAAQMSRTLRRLATVSLHDARVVATGEKEGRLFILLQRPEGTLVNLSYHLARPPQFIQHPHADEEPMEWLYDELDVHPIKDGVTVFQHSILLTNGLELVLWFYEVNTATYQPSTVPGLCSAPRALEPA